MFNALLDDLPTHHDGALVRTDYRQALKFFRITASRELDDEEKARAIVMALFGSMPKHTEGLWQFIEWYINGGDKDNAGGSDRVFDFNVDAGRVYAAFLQVYKIDLRECQIHWWLFLELFKALPDGTHLSRVMEIRGKKIEKGTDAKTAAAIRRAKRAYALDSGQVKQDFKGFLKG